MDEDIYRHIGRRIREERVRCGWTQEELAERLDLHLSFVSQLERGVKKPSLKTLKRIADIFRIKTGSLLDEPPSSGAEYPLEKKFAGLISAYPARDQQGLYKSFHQFIRQARKLSGK